MTENNNNNKKETIIFTDFDGTLTVKDSYMRSLFFYGGYKRLFLNIFSLSYNFTLFFLGKKTRNDMKNLTLKVFYKGKNLEELKLTKNSSFIKKKIQYFENVKQLIESIRKNNCKDGKKCKVVLVTASPNVYIEDVTKQLGYDGFICTKLETDENGLLTGKMIGENCNYKEKVERIKKSEFYNVNANIISFGNSKGDYEMFKISNEYYFVDKNGKVERNMKINYEL